MSLVHRSIPAFWDTLETRRLLSVATPGGGQTLLQPIDGVSDTVGCGTADPTAGDGGAGSVVDGANSDGSSDGSVDDGSAGDGSDPTGGDVSSDPTDSGGSGDGSDPTDGQLPGGVIETADGGPIMYAFGGVHATQSRHQRHVAHARHARAMARDAKAHRGVFASSAAAALWFHRHA